MQRRSDAHKTGECDCTRIAEAWSSVFASAFSDFFLRSRFLRRPFEGFTISPEEFGSHALAHHDHGGHPGGNAAEGDRGLESDRGGLETVSRSRPGRLL